MALVISRRLQEGAFIRHNGELLRVTIHSVVRNKIRLSFDGPTSFEVLRDEIADPTAQKSKTSPTKQEGESA